MVGLKQIGVGAPLVAALALLSLPVSAKAEDYPINPGYWEIRTAWLGLLTKTERYCIEPKNIAKFMSGPCNHIYHCSYPVQQTADGKVYFKGKVLGHDEAYDVEGGGDYSPTSLDVKFSGSGHWRFVPVVGATASIRAQFLDAACPIDAKRFK